MMAGMKWILGCYGLLGLVTFLTFGWDKWRATRHGRRVRERTLHLMEAAGGIVGALVAMTA
ncbi:MAG: DUF1294 domain-containing protein, partial [Phycisphaerales bacterium]|nr:DUF1294 domain-containing protein [Phycisphaerales bacterium]